MMKQLMDVFCHRGLAGALLLMQLAMATLQSTLPAWMFDTMQPTTWQIGNRFPV